jgi:hypothetical protein
LSDDFDGDKTLEELSTENFHKLREWAESGLELLKLVESASISNNTNASNHFGKQPSLDKSHIPTTSFSGVNAEPTGNIATSFENRCKILGEYWISMKDEDDASEFITINDIGLPLAFLLSEGLVSIVKPEAEQFVNETWAMFSKFLNLSDEVAYEDIESVAAALDDD